MGRGRAPVAVALALALFAALLVQASHPKAAQAAAAAWSTDRSVAYQDDAAHTGAQNHDSLKPPLIQEWVHPFPNNVSYPLIVNGRVFVTVAQPVSGI